MTTNSLTSDFMNVVETRDLLACHEFLMAQNPLLVITDGRDDTRHLKTDWSNIDHVLAAIAALKHDDLDCWLMTKEEAGKIAMDEFKEHHDPIFSMAHMAHKGMSMNGSGKLSKSTSCKACAKLGKVHYILFEKSKVHLYCIHTLPPVELAEYSEHYCFDGGILDMTTFEVGHDEIGHDDITDKDRTLHAVDVATLDDEELQEKCLQTRNFFDALEGKAIDGDDYLEVLAVPIHTTCDLEDDEEFEAANVLHVLKCRGVLPPDA